MALNNINSTGGRAIYLSWEGFHADMISLRLDGLFLISFITQPSWSIPCPV
jgi:hypothetical protein